MTSVATDNHASAGRQMVIALDWLDRGEPSGQFTRRRWIPWR